MIHFEEKDRQAWLAFLTTPSGAKGLAVLREQKVPSMRSAGQPHEMQFDLGSQKGFHEAIKEIEKLGRIPEEKTPTTADRPSLHATRRT
jgi:hypothetical protein